MSRANPQRTNEIRIQVPALHSAQKQILAESSRFNVLGCGRRFGKTTFGINLIVEPPLQGYPVAWFSPTYKMLSEVWREAKRILEPICSRVAVQEHRLELITGGVIDMWSLDNPNVARGRKYKRVVIDEAAMIADLQEAWQEVLRPTLTDYKGDGFMLSTPKGINFFHECFGRGQDKLQPDWASWQMPTTANPYISASEVEKARLELPEDVFRQEYLAEFLQNQGAVFRNVDACLKAEPTTPEAHKGHRIVAGVDWGQKNDFTCISILCENCKRELDLDRFNKIEWAFQRGRLKNLIQKWGVSMSIVELNSIGSPNFEALASEGLSVQGFETTAASKSPLIQSLALALERVEAQWLSDPVGRTELLAYESKRNAVTGRVSYSAPDGQHDDTVIARALAWHALTAGKFEQGRDWRNL